jgi:hypothetical protein
MSTDSDAASLPTVSSRNRSEGKARWQYMALDYMAGSGGAAGAGTHGAGGGLGNGRRAIWLYKRRARRRRRHTARGAGRRALAEGVYLSGTTISPAAPPLPSATDDRTREGGTGLLPDATGPSAAQHSTDRRGQGRRDPRGNA